MSTTKSAPRSTLAQDMMRAARANDDATVMSLLASAKRDKAHEKRALRCLLIAIQQGNGALALRLLDWGADPNGVGPGRLKPLTACVYARSPALAREMIARGADINAGPSWTPLITAAWIGAIEVAQVLVEAGADLNAGSQGTPLCTAAKYGHIELARFLIEHGALPDTPGDSALRDAIRSGRAESVRPLLQAGAQLRRELPRGGEAWDALDFARSHPKPDARITALLEEASRAASST